LIDKLSIPYFDQGHCTGAGALVTSCLEIYGAEVCSIRHGIILAENETICCPPFCTMHKRVCFVYDKSHQMN